MSYRIEYHPDVKKDIRKLTRADKQAVFDKIKEIHQDPERFLHLSGGYEGCYRARVGNLRVVYWVWKGTIYVLTIYPRKEAYTVFQKRLHNLEVKLQREQEKEA